MAFCEPARGGKASGTRPEGNAGVTILPSAARIGGSPDAPHAPMRADSLRRRFRYHTWATTRLCEALADTPVEAAIRPLAHALTADRVWLLRLRGEPTDAVALWPRLDAAGGLALARRNAADWLDVLAPDGEPLGDASLETPVRYADSRGDRHATPLGDVLDHVLLHAAYHRGQAAAALRAAGHAPPSTDFVLWLRLGEPAPDA